VLERAEVERVCKWLRAVREQSENPEARLEVSGVVRWQRSAVRG
jgi:hypothetical protein